MKLGMSFRKSKTDTPAMEEEEVPTEVSTKTYHERVVELGGIGHAAKKVKAPRKSLLRRKSKKEKSVKGLPPSKNLQSSMEEKPEVVQPTPSPTEEEPAPEPVEAPPAAESVSSAEEAAPMEEEQEPEEDEQPKEEERDEEEPKDEEPMEPAEVQTDDVSAPPMQEAPSEVADERDQPDDQPINPIGNFLCGCV